MTMLLLAMLGWCLVSVLVSGFWAAVCAGSQMRGKVATVTYPPVALPAPRTAGAREPVHA